MKTKIWGNELRNLQDLPRTKIKSCAAAQRYAPATNQMESVRQDIELVKKVVAGHNEF